MNKATKDIFSKKPPEIEKKSPEEEVVADQEQSDDESSDETTVTKKFIVVTQDFSGLGWAKRFKDEGAEVIVAYELEADDEKKDEVKRMGEGMFEVVDFKTIFKDRDSYQDHLWLFDMNIFSEEATTLRDEEFVVFGGQELSDKLEHDRNYATGIMEEYGLESPPTEEFKSIKDGLAFLEKNLEKAYVFKPDKSDGSWSTFVPDSEKDISANEELRTYMNSLGEGGGSYILQERIKGVETNFEVWFSEGTPFFAFAGLECKRKLNHDYGENVGCAQDIDFIIPLECKAIRETIGKLFPFYEEQNYTGFADVNVIVSKNKPYFLEVCNRFGYNAHPNLFLTLAKDKASDIIWDFAHGEIDDFYDRFNFGFGASIVLYADHIKNGSPLYISEDVEKNYFFFDGYMEDDNTFVTGYSNEIGIITAHDYTIKCAAEQCLKNADKVNFPNRSLRSDLDLDNYPSSPQSRYAALSAMKYFE